MRVTPLVIGLAFALGSAGSASAQGPSPTQPWQEQGVIRPGTGAEPAPNAETEASPKAAPAPVAPPPAAPRTAAPATPTVDPDETSVPDRAAAPASAPAPTAAAAPTSRSGPSAKAAGRDRFAVQRSDASHRAAAAAERGFALARRAAERRAEEATDAAIAQAAVPKPAASRSGGVKGIAASSPLPAPVATNVTLPLMALLLAWIGCFGAWVVRR